MINKKQSKVLYTNGQFLIELKNEESIMFSVYLGYQKHDNIGISVGANDYRDIYSITVNIKK